MNFAAIKTSLAGLLFTVITVNAWALMPTNPAADREFTVLPNGKKLTDIYVKGSRLTLAKGTGRAFTDSLQRKYEYIKAETMTNPASKTQWVLMDLDANRVVAESLSSQRKIFGASSSKIFVAGALLDQQDGSVSASQLQLMSDMLVVSSNTAWTNLQSQMGKGNANNGRAAIHAFTQRMGYEKTRGFQGYWGKIHGNELTAAETAQFLHDTYKAAYPGAETLWKLMHACRTGAERGRKYIPSSIYVGAKTGTYDGATVDPETGRGINVGIRNHVMVFNVENRQYGLVILADNYSDENTAILAGGLFREYTGYRPVR